MEEARIAEASAARRQRVVASSACIVVLVWSALAVVGAPRRRPTTRRRRDHHHAVTDDDAADTEPDDAPPCAPRPEGRSRARRRARPRTAARSGSPPSPRPRRPASTRRRPTRPTVKTTEGDITIALDTEHAPADGQQLRRARPLPLLRRHRPSTGSSRLRGPAGGTAPRPGSSGPGYDLPTRRTRPARLRGGRRGHGAQRGTVEGSQFFIHDRPRPPALDPAAQLPAAGPVTEGQGRGREDQRLRRPRTPTARPRRSSRSTVTITES